MTEESFKDGVKREVEELHHKGEEIEKIVAKINEAIEKGEGASELFFMLETETFKRRRKRKNEL